MKEVNVYNKRMKIVEGKGAYIWDEEGNRYFDALTGIGVAILGHKNEKVMNALKKQVEKLVVAGPMFTHEEKGEFFTELERHICFDYSFISNSGTEAVEAAIKFARLKTGKKRIISMTNAFHGRTLGSLSATWKQKYKKGFEPLVDGFDHIPFNDIEKAKEEINDETAAVILEPIQGQSGIIPAEQGFIEAVRDLTRDKEALLIDDEIQSGLRTGEFLAIDHYDIEPDIVTMGKGLANGVPIGLTMCNFDIPKGKHGSTFGGNPLACKAAAATLRAIEEKGLIEKISKKSIDFECDEVIKTRGRGLIKGAIMQKTVDEYMPELEKEGIITGVSGNRIIRFLPPLTSTEEQMTWLKEKFEEITDGI